MEYLLVIIALVSLTLNILIFKQLRSQNQSVVLAIEETWSPGILDCAAEFGELDAFSTEPQEAEPVPPASVATSPEEKHQAWVNRKGIPLTETVYVPAKPTPRPPAGPLERPGGFAL